MGVINTKEEKARRVLLQDEICGVDCDGGKENECPAYKQCTPAGVYRHSIAAKACREYLATLNNPGVWDKAPEWAAMIAFDYYTLDGKKIGEPLASHGVYTRELPKTLERKIAEKIAYNHRVVPGSREQLERIALDAIEEYKKQSSEHK